MPTTGDMGTLREARYKELIEKGCLKTEAFEWSKVDWKNPASGPYIGQMVESIRQNWLMHKTKGGTRETWGKLVTKAYANKGYVREELRKGRKVKVIDPWARLRATEDAYRKLNPSWESPHIKKWQDFRKTEAKIDRVLQYGA